MYIFLLPNWTYLSYLITDTAIFEGIGNDYLPTTKKQCKSNDRMDLPYEDSRVSNSRNRLPVSNTTTSGSNSNTNAESNSAQASYFDIPANADSVTNNSISATKEFLNELSQRFDVKDENRLQEKVGYMHICIYL